MALVTVLLPGFFTPRTVMHMWAASTITPTPRGCSSVITSSAICSVIRSCTCGRLATPSTTRASLLSPTTLPAGR